MVAPTKPTVLVILDGFGFSPQKKFNAVYHAKTPHLDAWLKEYPHTILKAAGTAVGLTPGQMGNSEVGHLTIGAGRIIQQDVVRILNAIDDGSFFKNELLIALFENLSKTKKSLHILGLLSNGGVHAHQKICDALLKLAKKQLIERVFVHAFLDGRDVPPKSAVEYLTHLDKTCKEVGIGKLGSMSGRYYAMDRDKNWERTEQAYALLTQKEPIRFSSWHDALTYYYQQGITDEFIPPTQFLHESIITNDDGVIFFNFRADRARQLTQAFLDPKFDHFPTKKVTLDFFATMTDYNHQLFQSEVIFKPITISHTIKEILEQHNKTMFSIAETEKYAHVTYFFGGGREKPFKNETRILIPSIPAQNYVDHPEMSAEGITDAIIKSLKEDPQDFYLINYANADMVGHSGDFEATVKAVEFLDHELGRLYKTVVEKCNGTLYITADHGNAEEMFDTKTNQPKTSHTNNPVYFIMIQKGLSPGKLNNNLHGLADIASFILKHMKY